MVVRDVPPLRPPSEGREYASVTQSVAPDITGETVGREQGRRSATAVPSALRREAVWVVARGPGVV